MRAVRKMWNIINVKTVNAGQAKRDDTRQPVADVTDDKLEYLLHFASWVKDLSSKNVLSLSQVRHQLQYIKPALHWLDVQGTC